MALFTCITDRLECIHLTQERADIPEAAIRSHIAKMPYSDATGPFDEELDWLQGFTSGTSPVELLPVGHCKNVWLWSDGARHEPQCLTYIVTTDPA